MESTELLNQAVKDWNYRNYQDIKDRYMRLIKSPKRSGDGFESLRYKLRYSYGEVESISYAFNRYLVFRHKGVGKGRGIRSGKERPAPWLNPVLDDNLPDLADIVKELKIEATLKRIQIK